MTLFVRTRLAFTVVAGLCISLQMSAQQANLNLEGVVRDETSGKPVGCKLYIYAPSGKRISITSNSKDGSYLQTLGEAGPHKIVAGGHNVYRKEFTVEIPKADRFRVIKQDLAVREIIEGTLISSTQQAFDRNLATLSPAGRKAVEDLAELLRVNASMNAVVTMSPDEDRIAQTKATMMADYKKQRDAWAKAVKKVKKGQPAPAEPVAPGDPVDPNIQLMKDRTAAIAELLKGVKLSDVRVSFVIKPLSAQSAAPVVTEAAPAKSGKKGKKAAPAPSKPKTNAVSEPNLVVTVGKVRGLYD